MLPDYNSSQRYGYDIPGSDLDRQSVTVAENVEHRLPATGMSFGPEAAGPSYLALQIKYIDQEHVNIVATVPDLSGIEPQSLIDLAACENAWSNDIYTTITPKSLGNRLNLRSRDVSTFSITVPLIFDNKKTGINEWYLGSPSFEFTQTHTVPHIKFSHLDAMMRSDVRDLPLQDVYDFQLVADILWQRKLKLGSLQSLDVYTVREEEQGRVMVGSIIDAVHEAVGGVCNQQGLPALYLNQRHNMSWPEYTHTIRRMYAAKDRGDENTAKDLEELLQGHIEHEHFDTRSQFNARYGTHYYTPVLFPLHDYASLANLRVLSRFATGKDMSDIHANMPYYLRSLNTSLRS